MKKTLLLASLSAAVFTGGLISPVEASRKQACNVACIGEKCAYKTPHKMSSATGNAVKDLVNATASVGGNVYGDLSSIFKWKSWSLAQQRKFCSECGWGHVRKWSGNYCHKGKAPGNY